MSFNVVDNLKVRLGFVKCLSGVKGSKVYDDGFGCCKLRLDWIESGE